MVVGAVHAAEFGLLLVDKTLPRSLPQPAVAALLEAVAVTDDEYTAQPCPPAACGGHPGMARSASMALWAHGLGGDLVITDPTRSRLLRFSARHTHAHREFSNTL
jgi:hypothetical protein